MNSSSIPLMHKRPLIISAYKLDVPAIFVRSFSESFFSNENIFELRSFVDRATISLREYSNFVFLLVSELALDSYCEVPSPFLILLLVAF
jgi:hypothetical protein